MSSATVSQQFVTALGGNLRVGYFYASALAFLAYDIIISLSQEVNYIWGSRLSLIKMLYFIVRYYSAINLMAVVAVRTSVNLSVPVCQRYYLWLFPAGPPLFFGVLDGILLLRVAALYGRSKRVFMILLTLIVGDVGLALYASIRLSQDLASSVALMPVPWRGCGSTRLPEMKIFLIANVLNYTLSLIFLGMTLWKLVENHQHIYGKLTLKNMRTMGNISPLLLAFVRDGSVFFALISSATFFVVLPIFVRIPGNAFLPWIFAIYSYSCAHLILNLRAAGTTRMGNTYQTWDETLTLQYRPDEGQGITFT